MLFGQGGKPTIHLVQIMEEVKRPFFMFVCSNCYCDICEKVRNLGYWSPVETLIFRYVLRRSNGCNNGKALVVDVGAHVGYFSLISASYGCRVVSFEPNSEAIRYLNLSRAVNDYGRISLHQKGVGRADTRAMYRQTDTWALNGFVDKRRKLTSDDPTHHVNDRLVEMENHPDSPPVVLNFQHLERGFSRRRILETTDVTMLDSVVEESVLLLKIDTEGYEANVLTGAKDLIYSQKIHHILVEVKQATSPAKRGLLWTIAKTGAYSHVYNWEEVVTPLSIPFHKFRLPNATIVDVTDIVHDQISTAPLLYQDFWFCRQPLPWL
jgi:FkbM family methyltransferase